MVEKTQITREERGRAKAKRRKAKHRALEEARQQEAAIQQSLSNPKRTLRDDVTACLPFGIERGDREPFVNFYCEVADKTPRLVSKSWGGPLYALWKAARCGDQEPTLQAWKPKLKGARSCFQLMARHLLEKYPQPHILWTALEEEPTAAIRLAPVVAHVARGGSLAKAPEDIWPFGLTKKQCHEVLNTNGMGFLTTIRYQQVKPFGGSPRLAQEWMKHRRGSTVGDTAEEAFWATVMAFFAKNPMLDLAQIGPIVDYIQWRRAEDEEDFSMKGRTAGALLRDVEEWHTQLHRAKVVTGELFTPSGIPHYHKAYRERIKGNYVEIHWRITEILSGKELADEGRALHHCVYSYSFSIQRGTTSIWSMTREEGGNTERRITIEVNNKSRRIMQARGRYNRRTDIDEFRAMNEWANKSGLSIGSYL